MKFAVALILASGICFGQEAQSGFQVEGTLSTGTEYTSQLAAPPRTGLPWAAGARFVLYPTWKIGSHWSFISAVQVRSRPYFFQEFSTQGYGLKADILQAQIAYSRVAKDRSFSIRAGQMSSAFGSFLLRYDDFRNPLIDMPVSYGYYQGVTTLGLMGAEVDATVHHLDLRAQFTNSSPANPRGIFDNGQYGDWAGGFGYTIVQGVRVGASAYRGPYLEREFKYFSPGESSPRTLPGTGYSIELEAARGPWNFYSEIQRFQYAYHVIPTFSENVWYAEVKRTLSPRWYAAFRINHLSGDYGIWQTVYETSIGFRPNRFQVVKIDYERQNGPVTAGALGNVLALQLVTRLSPLALTRN
jgi:hypothetical protein